MVLGQLLVSMQKHANQSIITFLYKAQVQVDNGPPHKTRYTETNRRESGGKPRTHGHWEKFSEQ